jgi:hypothetical protein
MQILPRFTAQSLVIASVYPIECTAERDYGFTQSGGRHKFILEAAKKGEFTTLPLSDMWQAQHDFEGRSNSGRQTMKAFFVDVDSLAKDLYNQWAVQRVGTGTGYRPGIAIIGGETPTDEETAFMNGQQRGYFEGLWHEGNALAAAHKHKHIMDTHRQAAIWLGQDAPWVANIGASNDWKKCVACREKIDIEATVCKVCRERQPSYAVPAPVPAPIVEMQPPAPAKTNNKPSLPPPLAPTPRQGATA